MPKSHLTDEIRGTLTAKPTQDLLRIWHRRNTEEYTQDAVDIVRSILVDRGVPLPSDSDPKPSEPTPSALPKDARFLEYAGPTRLLLAAAHLHNSKVHDLLASVRKDSSTLKAEPPNYFLDMHALESEVAIARDRERSRQFALIAIACASLAAVLLFGPIILLLGLVLLWIVEFGFAISRHTYVRKHFLPSVFVPSKCLTAIDDEPNVIMSSRFSPFVGAGYPLRDWSFTVDTNRPSGPEAPRPVSVSDLYSEINTALDRLRVPGLRITDKLVTYGTDIRRHPELLPSKTNRPRVRVPLEVVLKYLGYSQSAIRHYRLIQIPSWEGHLILSVFLRFCTIGSSIFVEAHFYLLPPLQAQFQVIDSFNPKVVPLGDCAFRALVVSPFSWLGGLAEVVNETFSLTERQTFAALQEAARENERFDYGAIQSLRELWGASEYDRYFQLADRDMYLKVVEQGILDSLVDSLESRGVSTDVIKERSTLIVNEGLVVTGGVVEAQSLVVGKGSRAKLTTRKVRHNPKSVET